LHFSTGSNNTILELTNDFSKGGVSSGKVNQNNSSYATSNKSMALLQKSEQRIQHISLVLKEPDESLITPRRASDKKSQENAQFKQKEAS